MTSYKGRPTEGLCCCEFINIQGETSHILSCCCDCEVLDNVCDRFLRCQRISPDSLAAMFATIEDRCRIPWCSRQGAIKIKLDYALPVVMIPGGLLLATLNSYLTWIVMIALPATLLLLYTVWSRDPVKRRSPVFFVWGLTSSICMYVVFEGFVISFREILLWENLLLSTIYGLMFYALYNAKQSPGRIQRRQPTESDNFQKRLKARQQKLQETWGQLSDGEAQQNVTSTMTSSPEANVAESQSSKVDPRLGPIGSLLIENFGFDKDVLEESVQEMEDQMQGEILRYDEVTCVDSRIIPDGRLVTWCEHCRLVKPPRCGHCPVCDACIQDRDHHCVWIDSCVGAQNHRSFLLGLLLLVICGFYGIHLTLTTVCTPEMYLNWLLFANDCRFVYADFMTALCWVSACYSLIMTGFMFVVLIEQVVLISQNLTSQERHTAFFHGWIRCCCIVSHHPGNQGCLRNWINFFSGQRRKPNQTDVSVV